MDFTIFQQFAVALALGTLIGLEREHRFQTDKYTGFGGIRTFALIAIFGVLTYMLLAISVAFFAVMTAGFLALVITSYIMSSRNGRDFGVTSEVAAFLVYLIGILSGMEQYLVATFVALTVLVILHFKDPLHRWAKRLKSKELVSTIEFIIITFVILPLLPNKGFGPYEFFNPYIVWLMVVFVSGISFASYIAMKLFGAKRGILLTGFLAGFISTTALSFSFAAQSKKNKKLITPYVLGISIAVSALFFRVLLEVFVLNRELSYLVAIPFVAMGLLAIILSFVLFFHDKGRSGEVDSRHFQMESPFQLAPAIKFALIFAVVLLVTKFAANAFGNEALYLAAFVGGFFDVDSITLSMSRLADHEISEIVATIAITIGVLTNNLSKIPIFMLFGNKKVAFRLFLVFLPITVLGAFALFFI